MQHTPRNEIIIIIIINNIIIIIDAMMCLQSEAKSESDSMSRLFRSDTISLSYIFFFVFKYNAAGIMTFDFFLLLINKSHAIILIGPGERKK